MELSARSIKKINSILKNAEREFIKYGFNKVTMDGVAAKANVSKMTLYKYFSDKSALYEEILKNNYFNEFDQIEEIINGDMFFKEKIDEIVKIRLEKYRNKDQLIVEEDYDPTDEFKLFIKERSAIMEELNSSLYEQGKNEGMIREDLTDETISFYFSIIRSGLVQNFSKLQNLNDKDLTILLEVLYAGVLGCKIKN